MSKLTVPEPNRKGFKNPSGIIQIAVRCDEKIFRSIQKYAEVNGRSISNAIIALCVKQLNREISCPLSTTSSVL